MELCSIWAQKLSHGIISNMEPCSIWDDVEVGPTNIRVTPLKHTHLDFGSARSNWLIQFDGKFICDQPIEGAIDVLSPEFSIWGRFYVQSVLGKHINYCLPISKEFCLKFKLSATVSMILDSHPPLRPSTVVYVNGVRLKLVALVKKTSLSTFLLLEKTDLNVRPPRSSSCSEKKPLKVEISFLMRVKTFAAAAWFLSTCHAIPCKILLLLCQWKFFCGDVYIYMPKGLT